MTSLSKGQMTLPLPAFQQHSDTSHDAAVSVRESAPTMRERVYRAIASSMTGLTDQEIGDVLSMKGDTVRPRRVELVGKGRVMSAGTRATRSGRRAVVWTAVRSWWRWDTRATAAAAPAWTISMRIGEMPQRKMMTLLSLMMLSPSPRRKRKHVTQVRFDAQFYCFVSARRNGRHACDVRWDFAPYSLQEFRAARVGARHGYDDQGGRVRGGRLGPDS